MKVLILTMALDIGGAETHVYNLSKGLKEKGIEPIVVSKGGVYVPLLENEGIVHMDAPLDKKDFKSIKTSMKIIKKIIEANNIGIIHAHGRIPALLGKMLSKKYKKPFIVTAHAKFKYNLVYKYTSFWGIKTICISEDIKDYLVNQFGVNKNQITIIENGIDTDLFKNTIESKENHPVKIVCVSRIDESLGKMCKTLIDAVAFLDQEDKNIELNIVGEGSYFPELQNYVSQIQLKKSTINLLGKRTDVFNILQNNNIAVCVSRSAMEAMACELSIIIAGGEGYMGILDENNIEEAMNNNLTGRGYDKMISPESLKNDIDFIINKMNAKEDKRMGAFNRKIILDHYSLKGMIEKTIKVYNEVLGVEKNESY